jgi:RNA polymerase sigma factor (sigma-70 family)
MIPTDEALMLAVRDGDLDRLSVLFDRYHARLFEFFRRMNSNRATAEDLVQDVFFRVLKYRQTFRDDNRFVPWVYRIARNARLQHYKKNRVEDSPAQAPTMGESNAPSPAMEFEKEQEASRVRMALARLDDEKRELLVLVWYQEMKYEHIAELLGINVGAVKVRVYRAVRELREILSKTSEKQPCVVKTFKTTLRTI